MVLNYWKIPAPMHQVLADAWSARAWDPTRYWLHGPLVEVLSRYGLVACRRNWRLLDGRESSYLAGRAGTEERTAAELAWVRRQMLAEGLGTAQALLQLGAPLVASVHRPFGQRSGPGHQVVLIGADGGALYYHDPAELPGSGLAISKEDFMHNWKGTALIAAPEGHQALAGQPQ